MFRKCKSSFLCASNLIYLSDKGIMELSADLTMYSIRQLLMSKLRCMKTYMWITCSYSNKYTNCLYTAYEINSVYLVFFSISIHIEAPNIHCFAEAKWTNLKPLCRNGSTLGFYSVCLCVLLFCCILKKLFNKWGGPLSQSSVPIRKNKQKNRSVQPNLGSE